MSEQAINQYHELCRLRSTLEAFAAVRLGTSPGGADTVARLRKQLARLKSTAQKGRYDDFHKADMALHRELVLSCGIPVLVDCWDRVAQSMTPDLLKVRRDNWPSLMSLYREHLYLLEAWESGDEKVVEQATHHHLETGWYRIEAASGKVPSAGGAVDRAASFLSTHFTSQVNMEWMARNVSFVSISHLNRLFREQMGKSPYAWLRQVRMDRACLLLKTSKESVAEIGKRVGYKNASHFARDFKVVFGVTPLRYRARAE